MVPVTGSAQWKAYECLRKRHFKKQKYFLGGWYHEMHNEEEKEKIFQTTTKWLDAHLP